MITISLWFLTSATLAITAITVFNSNNPLNISVLLVCVTAVMITWTSLTSQSTWIIWSVYLLFIGGIIAVFIILSSLIPNNNPGNISMSTSLTTILILGIVSFSQSNFETSGDISMNSFIGASTNLMMATGVIIAYFAAFVTILAPKNSALKSTFCS